MKLALGTVQYGIKYGINNSNEIPSDLKLQKIFKLAFDNRVDVLDTSPNYGTSEKRIGDLSKSEFNIVTKVPFVENSKALREIFNKSLISLKTDFIYGYIFHDSDNLIRNPLLWEEMLKLKNEKKVNKIGYSLYTPSQLDELLKKEIIPDIVQLPYSILDRKFEPYFQHLKKLNIEIHVRSIFLQGLYFMEKNKIPQNLSPIVPHLMNLHKICSDNKISMASLAINFVKENPNIDKIILGIDSEKQLSENISVMNQPLDKQIINYVKKIEVDEKELLNPVNWK